MMAAEVKLQRDGDGSNDTYEIRNFGNRLGPFMCNFKSDIHYHLKSRSFGFSKVLQFAKLLIKKVHDK